MLTSLCGQVATSAVVTARLVSENVKCKEAALVHGLSLKPLRADGIEEILMAM